MKISQLPSPTTAFSIRLAVAFTLLLMQTPSSDAATSCDTTVVLSSNTVLGTDYELTSNGGACIKLTNGADLDMNGKKITCKSTVPGHCQTAIEAEDAGSYVTNSVPGNVAIENIGYGWVYGVREAERVTDLRIDSAFYGIFSSNATTISGNVLTNVVNCIFADLPAATSVIEHNLCDHAVGVFAPTIGIQAVGESGTSGPIIRRNMVLHAQQGIYGDLPLRLNDNIVCDEQAYGGFGFGVVVRPSESQTGQHNLCCNEPEYGTDSGCKSVSDLSASFTLWP